MQKGLIIAELPEKDSPDFFRTLVNNCINAYRKFNNDSLALDFCKVSDKKLRAYVLDDEEYKRETKSIYAEQRMAEIDELEYLAKLAAREEEEEQEETGYVHPSERGKKQDKSDKKSAAVDRDMLTMRFKAAQLKRELMAEMAKSVNNVELDVVNLMYVPVTQEELLQLQTIELNEGSGDADLDELLGTKEEVPIGTVRPKTKTKVPKEDEEVLYEMLPNGELVERL